MFEVHVAASLVLKEYNVTIMFKNSPSLIFIKLSAVYKHLHNV